MECVLPQDGSKMHEESLLRRKSNWHSEGLQHKRWIHRRHNGNSYKLTLSENAACFDAKTDVPGARVCLCGPPTVETGVRRWAARPCSRVGMETRERTSLNSRYLHPTVQTRRGESFAPSNLALVQPSDKFACCCFVYFLGGGSHFLQLPFDRCEHVQSSSSEAFSFYTYSINAPHPPI